MSTTINRVWFCVPALLATLVCMSSIAAGEQPLSISWRGEMLSIRGPRLPGGELPVHYLEAFCRPGSTDRDWQETVIPHRTRLVEARRRSSPDPAPIPTWPMVSWSITRFARGPTRSISGSSPPIPARLRHRRLGAALHSRRPVHTNQGRGRVGDIPARLFPLRERHAHQDAGGTVGAQRGMFPARSGALST